jgi:multidrug efflux pump subunit AcrA (membrane-fusion protein)
MARSAEIALLLALFFAAAPRAMAQDEKPQSSPVIVTEVVERELAEGQTLVGTVVPARRSIVGSAVDGRVLEYAVQRGQAVKKGQILARLRTTQLEISLRAAKAELANRTAALNELKNGARPEQIAEAAGMLAATVATLDSAKSRYERAKSLYSRKAMNAEQFQDVTAGYQAAKANYSAAQARHALLKNGNPPEQIDGSRARVEFQAEQVNLIEEQIARHTVVAPFDGYIAQAHSQIGQWLGRGDPIAEVIELSDVEVEVFVLEKYLANLKIGANVQVTIPSVPSEFFPGRIVNIVPQADLRSRSFPVRIRVKNTIDNSVPAIKSGMLARANMPLGKRGLAMLVEKDAVVFGGREPTVFVLDKHVEKSGEAVVRGVPVRLGVMDEDLIEVSGQLKAGDQIVIRGNERLQSGQKIRVTEIRTPAKLPTARKAAEATKPASTGLGS